MSGSRTLRGCLQNVALVCLSVLVLLLLVEGVLVIAKINKTN